jgi:protein-disulfide isomerase
MENSLDIPDTAEKKRRGVLVPSLVGIILLLLGFIAYNILRPTEPTKKPLPPPQDQPAALGAPQALVTIEIFSDFQCPFCAQSVPVLKQILQEHPSDVRMVFRHFPVAQSHPNAPLVHMAALAAGRQQRFWEMHDIVFENQKQVADEDLLAYAEKIGLDMKAFRNAFQDLSLISRIKTDFDEGVERGVRATPTFFINGRKMEGAIPYPEFNKAIEQAIADARQGLVR